MVRRSTRSLLDALNHWRQGETPNRPQDYLAPNKWARSAWLVERVVELVGPDAAILEIGCNAGRNLAALWRAGFTDLTGVELSRAAIDLLRAKLPELGGVVIHNGAIEQVVGTLGTFDLVFSLAVFEHIHPASEGVFEQIAGLTTGYLVTIEDERSRAEYHFPRNYRAVFEACGLEQVDERVGLSEIGLDDNFIYRCFRAHAD